MDLDRFTEEIYPGIILVADEVLERMCGSPYIKGSLVPNFSDLYEKNKECGAVWEKLTGAYPDLENISSGAIEEIKRRLFSNHHILLARSVASNFYNLRYSLEHEYFEKLCESDEEAKSLLARAYECLFVDQEAPFLIMDLFSGSHYTRYPPIIEFWSQWFRPSFVGYNDLALLSKLKVRVRGLTDTNVQTAILLIEKKIGDQVKEDVEKILAKGKVACSNDDLSRAGARERILIVDDEVSLCEMLKAIIEDEIKGRFQVDYAVNAKDTMRLIREKAYNLILLDIKLNGSSGMDVLKECRPLAARPKIIIHSALSSDSQYPLFLVEGVADLVTDYLDKNHDLSIPEFLHYLERILAVKEG